LFAAFIVISAAPSSASASSSSSPRTPIVVIAILAGAFATCFEFFVDIAIAWTLIIRGFVNGLFVTGPPRATSWPGSFFLDSFRFWSCFDRLGIAFRFINLRGFASRGFLATRGLLASRLRFVVRFLENHIRGVIGG
jgi:hypothetical protein